MLERPKGQCTFAGTTVKLHFTSAKFSELPKTAAIVAPASINNNNNSDDNRL
jgi:hypothetical protein